VLENNQNIITTTASTAADATVTGYSSSNQFFISIRYLFIYMQTQHPRDQLQSEQE
jgi:hypothetical protein